MPEVFVGAGSNIEPARHLRAALVALADRYGVLRLSPLYRNPSVGFHGEDFLNMVIGFDTDESVESVASCLAAIETANGRARSEARFAPRTLDLDLLLYGDLQDDAGGVTLPRDEILRYAFVLKPLSDLAPDHRHPVTGARFADLWAQFDGGAHPLERVEIDLPGRDAE